MRVGAWFYVLLLAAINELPVANSNNSRGGSDVKAGGEYCTVSLEQTNGTAVLRFKITNTTGSSLKVNTSMLPWELSQSIMLYAAEGSESPQKGLGLEHETMLPKFYPLENPIAHETTIEPGTSLTGTVDLNRRFLTLKEVVKSNDVVIFWSYRLRPIDSAPLKRVAGSVVIYSK